MRDDTRLIEKEDWQKALGIKADKEETNSRLATRGYSVKCNPRYCITVIKAYWIWWCSAHHQPYDHCFTEKERLSE